MRCIIAVVPAANRCTSPTRNVDDVVDVIVVIDPGHTAFHVGQNVWHEQIAELTRERRNTRCCGIAIRGLVAAGPTPTIRATRRQRPHSDDIVERRAIRGIALILIRSSRAANRFHGQDHSSCASVGRVVDQRSRRSGSQALLHGCAALLHLVGSRPIHDKISGLIERTSLLRKSKATETKRCRFSLMSAPSQVTEFLIRSEAS
jgi:hypothetical protein